MNCYDLTSVYYKIMPKTYYLFISLLSLAALSACKPDYPSIAEEYRGDTIQLKNDVHNAAVMLKEMTGTETFPLCSDITVPLDAPYLYPNFFVMMQDKALQIDNRHYHAAFNIGGAARFERALDWLYYDYQKKNTRESEKEFRLRFEQQKNIQYLVLNTITDFKRPKVISANEFIPGSVHFTLSIISLYPQPKLLCQSKLAATTPENITMRVIKDVSGSFTQENLQLNSSLRQAAKKEQEAIFIQLGAYRSADEALSEAMKNAEK
jgi:hypothetical protein